MQKWALKKKSYSTSSFKWKRRNISPELTKQAVPCAGFVVTSARTAQHPQRQLTLQQQSNQTLERHIGVPLCSQSNPGVTGVTGQIMELPSY
jgi:hypothetical protein